MIRQLFAAFFYALMIGIALSSCTPLANHDSEIPNAESDPSHQAKLQPQSPNQKPSIPEPEPDNQRSVQKLPSPAASHQPGIIEKAAPPSPETKLDAKPKSVPTQQVSKKSRHYEKTVREAASRNKGLTLSQIIKKYPDLLLLKGPGATKQVALTFDDAPDRQFTPHVLNILKQYKVHATFFLVGSQAEKYPDIVKRMVREGHVIGNHSYNHKLFTELSDESFKSQVLLTQKSLKSLIGYSPRLIRPPYGEISENQLLWASKQGYRIVNWNVDSQDWKQLSRDQVTENILNHIKKGSIVLQHSGGGPGQNLSGTVEALPTVIQTLQSRGYKLVTLPELLQVSKQVINRDSWECKTSIKSLTE